MTQVRDPQTEFPRRTFSGTSSGANVNEHVKRWVGSCAEMCGPSEIFWCDGSEGERSALLERAVGEGVLIRLNQQKLPGLLPPSQQPQRRRPHRAAHVHLHAQRRHGRPDQQLDGNAGRPTPSCAGSFAAAWRAGRCMSSRSSWGRSAHRWPRSACSSPIRSTSPSACGS